MNKTENFWDKASKGYDKSEARFEYIHNMTRENAKKYLDISRHNDPHEVLASNIVG